MADKDIKDKQKEQKSGSNPFNNFKGKGKDGKSKFNFYWIYGILALILFGVQFIGLNDEGKQTDWRDLKQMLVNDDVSKIILEYYADRVREWVDDSELHTLQKKRVLQLAKNLLVLS